MTIDGPDEFADLLLKTIGKWAGHERIANELNLVESDRWLRDLVSSAYVASMATDERRPVRCRIVVAPGYEPDIRFDDATPFSGDAVRRLSPVAASIEHGLIVDPAGSPKIVGMVDFKRFLNAQLGMRSSFNVDKTQRVFLSIRICGPGHLTAYVNDIGSRSPPSVSLRMGSCSSSRSQGSVYGCAVESIYRNLWNSRSDAMNGLLSESLIVPVASVLSHLCTTAITLGHGALFVVMLTEETCLEDVVNFRFRTRFPIGDAITQHAASQNVADEMQAQTDAFRAQSLQSALELEEKSVLAGSLSSVDGAVVFNHRLDLVGFGATILGNVAPEDVEHIAKFNGRDPGELLRWGHRRQAALQVVTRCRNAMAIVVSEDGDTRILMSDDDGEVRIEENFELSLRSRHFM